MLNDLYFPGWRATIDGLAADIYLANYMFRAVRLSPGKHTIIFRYFPLSFYGGLGLALIGLLIIVAFVSLPRGRAREG